MKSSVLMFLKKKACKATPPKFPFGLSLSVCHRAQYKFIVIGAESLFREGVKSSVLMFSKKDSYELLLSASTRTSFGTMVFFWAKNCYVCHLRTLFVLPKSGDRVTIITMMFRVKTPQ